jgi:hypothetical protein
LRSHSPVATVTMFLGSLVLTVAATTASAQVTPAAGYSPPDDTPSIKIGAVIFADYTYQNTPKAKDAAGNDISSNSFNLARTYVNVTGNISHLVSYRITPDITRATQAGTSLDGSMAFRLKYGYLQVNLDDWMPKGTYVRFGMIQTLFIDSVEGVYRYRFQGTVFPEREGYMSSADVGVSFRTAFPRNYGDVQVGVFNGEGYSKPESNNKKAFEARASLRPLPHHRILRNWRLQGFVHRDSVMNDAARNRSVFDTTFEHPNLNVGFDYLSTKDKASAVKTAGVDLNPTLNGKGWSVWLTPKKPFANGSSIEALVRYDHMKPGGAASATAITSPDAKNQRTIAGLSFWFPKQGSVSAALLLDYEQVKYSDWAPAKATQERVFLHSLISF